MGKKLHLYHSEDLIVSALDGVKITALCGLNKRVTREDVDTAARADRPVCVGCLHGFADTAKEGGATLRKPEGWVAHLESQARAGNRPSYTVKIASSATWNFPLAS